MRHVTRDPNKLGNRWVRNVFNLNQGKYVVIGFDFIPLWDLHELFTFTWTPTTTISRVFEVGVASFYLWYFVLKTEIKLQVTLKSLLTSRESCLNGFTGFLVFCFVCIIWHFQDEWWIENRGCRVDILTFISFIYS